MKNKRIIKWISFTEWMPCSVCSTSSGDLLVILNSNSNMQTKAVRYFGSKEKQVIQFNEVVQSLFSSGYSIRYLRENRNLDICVSDCKGRSVVVANKTGKHRFTYTGPPLTSKDSFDPSGITTDSQSRILITDYTSRVFTSWIRTESFFDTLPTVRVRLSLGYMLRLQRQPFCC